MTYPAAERWDLRTQDFASDSDGTLTDEHEVDAAVTICLGWQKGTLTGDPETGHTLNEVDVGAPDAVRHRDVYERQQASIQWLINKGLVELLSVDDEIDQFGRLSVLTKYKNLVTDKPGKVQS
jgi:hypothetical protein